MNPCMHDWKYGYKYDNIQKITMINPSLSSKPCIDNHIKSEIQKSIKNHKITTKQN